MTAQMPHVTATSADTKTPVRPRRPDGADPFLPMIALDLARTTAVCVALPSVLEELSSVRVPVNTADAARHLARNLSSASRRHTLESAVVAQLLAYVQQCVADRSRHVRAQLADHTGVDEDQLDDDHGKVLALAQVGVDVVDLSDDQLAPHRRRFAVRLLVQLRRLQTLQASVGNAGVAGRLRQVWGSTTEAPGGVEGTTQQVTDSHGIDGRRLLDCVIRFEARNHERLVWQQANRLAKKYPDRTADELYGFGWAGLLTALRKFDVSLGYKFSTYACTRISGNIRDGVRAENRVPKRAMTYMRKMSRAEEALWHELSRQPTLKEVADRLGDDVERLELMERLRTPASTDEMLRGSADHPGDTSWMEETTDPARETIEELQTHAVLDALERLPDDEKQAVQMLVMDNRTFKETRKLTGVSSRQLRSRRDAGLERLQNMLASWV